MKKYIIPEVTVEIGDNLYLRITDVSFLPAVKGVTSALPEDCFPDEPAEYDWRNENAKLIIKEKIFIGMSKDNKIKKYEWKEKEFPVDDGFVYEYYKQIITAIEEEEEW